jgi:hypothetical protein
MDNNELVVKESGYLVTKNFDKNSEIFEEIEGMTEPFEKIKVPIGGAVTFEIPGDNGELEDIKEIEGVILCHHLVNVYYKEKYTGGVNLPDCSSNDGNIGQGNPGGDCSKCPYNEFGSGEGKGKACKNKKRVFILKEGNILPAIIYIPSGSMKDFGVFITRLISKGIGSNAYVIKISLKKATNSNCIVYSQVFFSVKRKLTEEEYNCILPLSNYIKDMAKNIVINADDENQGDEKPKDNEDIVPLI